LALLKPDEAGKPLPAHVCPACGGPNGCVPARIGTFDEGCWCRALTIDQAMIAALPEAVRLRACLCVRCATAGSDQPAASTRPLCCAK
jgi:hypothetical protein